MMAKYARTRENQRTREATGSLEIPSRRVASESRARLRVSPCEPCGCEISLSFSALEEQVKTL